METASVLSAASSQTPALTTARLLLRPLCLEDAPAAFAGWVSDPDVTYYMPYHTHRSIKETEQWLASEAAGVASPTRYNWGIAERAGGQLVGTIGLNLEGDACELGYCLAKSRWGRGYMTEAVGCAVEFARHTLGVKRVYARVAVGNIPSARVLQKLGFAEVGECTYTSYDETRCFAARRYELRRI